MLRLKLFPPSAEKELRSFSSVEAAGLIGISDAYLRQLEIAGEIPKVPKGSNGQRLYSLKQINAVRDHLASASKAHVYDRSRRAGEHLQVLAVTNFKGGSGKTTTCAHLAQYLALRGYRVLALDLDPPSQSLIPLRVSA